MDNPAAQFFAVIEKADREARKAAMIERTKRAAQSTVKHQNEELDAMEAAE